MRTPSWVELIGRNVAAGAVAISGSLRVAGNNSQDQPVDERFEFWHGGAGQWRIESGGKVAYIAADNESAIVFADGKMRRQHPGRIRMAWVGSMFSPLDLLGTQSLLNKMSTGMRVTRETEAVVINGRSAWSTTLASPNGDGQVDLAFDDVTGILVQLRSPEGGGLLEVANLAEHDQIESERFTWDGPISDADASRHNPREQAAQRIEILDALVRAQQRPNDLLQKISGAGDEKLAVAAIMELLDVTETGAHAVLAMQIRRFRGTEIVKIQRELAELRGLRFDSPPVQTDVPNQRVAIWDPSSATGSAD